MKERCEPISKPKQNVATDRGSLGGHRSVGTTASAERGRGKVEGAMVGTQRGSREPRVGFQRHLVPSSGNILRRQYYGDMVLERENERRRFVKGAEVSRGFAFSTSLPDIFERERGSVGK